MVHVDSHAQKDGILVDFHGRPVDKSRTGGWMAAGLILGTELSERVCVMGISMNLVTYLVGDLHLSSAKSANIVTNFMGTLNLLGLLGGFVADARLGRYKTVALSASITALGVILLTLATTLPSMRPPLCPNSRRQDCIPATGQQLMLLYTALYTIALGGGGIKSNVSGFGSDQFDTSNPKEEKAMVFFFNRFYFCISLGSLFAVTILVYIQDNVGRGWGYGISAGTMLIAVAVFLFGTMLYRFRMPQGSPLTVIWRVVYLAWKKRSLAHPPRDDMLNGYYNAKVPHTEKFRCLDKAAILEDKEMEKEKENESNGWIVSTVTQVEEVKMVIKLLPIWSTCILFWTVYSQMNTFSIEQATFMYRRIGSFEVPAGTFSVFLFFSILLFTSLNERVFVPLARKITHKPHGITCLQRIGIGLVFSVLGMVAAALVEKMRRERHLDDNIRVSAFWLVPQFFLVGAGEAFAYVGQLEFFIREAPERMKSMSTGLFLSTLSMGFFVSSLLVSLVDKATKGKWLKSNLNKGNLDNFYWLLAILGVLNFFVFIGFAVKHQYKMQQNYIVPSEDRLHNEADSSNNGHSDKTLPVLAPAEEP
ncbi:protein NRT1/ PTR FAMILY 6.4 [Andrographis paniculata]|uniref:protein NRT1/ PTR FAMILY 6.4 n=1 Tax=Andrographis paniculata TaxID=175694 RepID=UPI0021E82B57|nr:protein NRT1/ PTR FAMILY 6.4 [Andrographis paniculata]